MKLAVFAATSALLFFSPVVSPAQDKPVDGQFPPPLPPAGKWENLFAGKLTDTWTGMSMSVEAPWIKTSPHPERPGDYVLHIARGSTGVIRSLKVYENFILEVEWRHLTEAPSAGGGKGTSGNSGILVCHGALPAFGGPFPALGHEVQVCNLGNGSWYTSHGDVFSLPGTASQAIPDPRFGQSHSCGHRSMPVEFRAAKTGEWNRVRITCVDGVLQQEVNGALVTSLYRISPRKGYLSIESEGAPVEFRHMRLQELAPDPDLNPRHIAPLLPETMKADYVTSRQALKLTASNGIVVADLKKPLALSALAEGLGLPDTEVKGRVQLSLRDGKVSVTVDNKALGEPVPYPPNAPWTLHLEANSGAFGHVLVLTPAKG